MESDKFLFFNKFRLITGDKTLFYNDDNKEEKIMQQKLMTNANCGRVILTVSR